MTSPSELTMAVQEGTLRAARATAAGAQAFARLLRLAENLDSGQARRVARFLASTFDGETFNFDLFDLRAVDVAIGDDMLRCLDALRWGRADLHRLVPDGETRVLAVIERWGLHRTRRRLTPRPARTARPRAGDPIMKTLVLCNHKGGVGKSAVATLLAHYLAQRGQRVLAIDLDHQGNLSRPLRLCGRATVSAFTADALMTGPTPAVPHDPFVLVPADRALLGLERQPALHSPFARQLRAFLAAVDGVFDVCIVDTNPNPDIRVIAALASADFVLSPIQLNQEAMDGVGALLNHDRVGLRKIKAVLNPKLTLIGLLPTLVEPTPFQRANFAQVVQQHHALLIRIGNGPGAIASIPRRSCIAEAQAEGVVLWEMKKTAARDAWHEIAPSLARIADIVTASTPLPQVSHAAAA